MTPQKVRDARETLGMTQTDLAAKLGVSRPVVQKWEMEGTHHRPIPAEKAALLRAMLTPPRDESGVSSAFVPMPESQTGLFTNDRLAIIGPSDCGKTTLLLRLLAPVTRFVLCDPNEDIAIPGVPVVAHFTPHLPRQIVRANRGEWDAEVRAVYEAGGYVLVLDDLTLIHPGKALTGAIADAVNAGRDRNVAVWITATQPRGVTRGVIEQAKVIFAFWLPNPDHRRFLSEVTHPDLRDWEPETEYGFVRWDRGFRGLAYYDSGKPPRIEARAEMEARWQQERQADVSRKQQGEERAKREREQRAEQEQQERITAAHRTANERDERENEKFTARVTEREMVTVPRTKFDELQQQSYDKGVRDTEKRAASPQKQLPSQAGLVAPAYPASTRPQTLVPYTPMQETAPPRLPIPPRKPSFVERLLLGKRGASTVPAAPHPPPPMDNPYTEKLSSLPGMPRR